jgi:hypothetical protein
LRTDERGEPIWIVTLLSKSAHPVGTIHIGANRGTVRRTEGMFAGTTMEDVETEYDGEDRGMITNVPGSNTHLIEPRKRREACLNG